MAPTAVQAPPTPSAPPTVANGSVATSRVHLLGAFELWFGDELVELPQSAQRLLAFLALHDRPLQRSFVSGSLWLDTTDQRASANLRSTLWRLRRPGFDPIDSSITHLSLGSSVVVDLCEGTLLARRLVDCADEADGEHLRGATTGPLATDLLPDWLDDDFVLVEQERWRQLRIHALESLARRMAATERFGEAIDAALAAIAAEPLRESAHRTLISVHLAEGNSSEARRSYVRFRDLLQRELGLAPSETMERLLS